MWELSEITVEIGDAEHPIMIVAISTPAGRLEIIGALQRVGRTLHVRGAHIQGLDKGRLGRSGLNVIGRKLLVEADVDRLVIEGGTRTTGRTPGKKPRVICFPSGTASDGPR